MTRHPSGSRIRALVPAIALVPALALLVLASPAGAQYMYLDSNGDGVHTAIDEVHETGPTVVDIWLDTGHNRDGTATACSANTLVPLDMFGYGVVLEAVDGTVTFSTFTNRIAEMGPVDVPHTPDTRYYTGSYFTPGTTSLPLGRYLLGTLTINVTSGTPSIRILAQTDWGTPLLYDDKTVFFSHCDGTLYPNSIAFEVDWFDADGLTYAAGGMPNRAPLLAAIADIVVRSGENASRAITATDPEGQPLTFSKLTGPQFLFVTTLEQGAGTARGEIRAAPFVSDVGTDSVAVSVTDGAASDRAIFRITVSHGPNHAPYLAPIPKLTVIAGEVRSYFLSAGDPDGGTIHFAKISGPGYVALRELATRSGGGSAIVTLRPTICDVGSATAAFSVTDGLATQQRQVALSVVPSSPRPVLATQYFPAGFMSAIRLADLNADGHLDVVAAHEDRPAISILLGSQDGNGDLSGQALYPVLGQNGSIAVGDFDGNGTTDVAVTNPEGANLGVYPGRGDGTLLSGRAYETGTGPAGITAEDMNRDGFLDLVVMNEESGTVSVLIGAGDGTFGARRDSPAGIRPTAFEIGDFNLDGRADVILTNSSVHVLTMLPGLGDGAFGNPVETQVNGAPFSLAKGDWNWDGLLDLAVVDIGGTVQTFSGRGDGTFDPGDIVATAEPQSIFYACAAEDMNGDGNPDLVVSDVNIVRLLILLGDGAGGFAAPLSLSGRFAAGLAIGDMNSDGRPDMVGTAALAVGVYFNTFPAPAPGVEARASIAGGNRTLPLTGKKDVCVRIELVGQDSNDNPVVDPSSVVLRSEGTGSVSEIHAIAAKRVVVADTDRNANPEVTVCFASQDFAALFDKIRKRTAVSAQLSGGVLDGRQFCTTIELNIVGKGPSKQATFAPNPLNPVSRLTFTTVREGPAKALLFNIQGRLIRRLLDTPHLPAGAHEYLFDGKGDGGEQLPSGVYFYRVESTEGLFDGRIVILK